MSLPGYVTARMIGRVAQLSYQGFLIERRLDDTTWTGPDEFSFANRFANSRPLPDRPSQPAELPQEPIKPHRAEPEGAATGGLRHQPNSRAENAGVVLDGIKLLTVQALG